MRRIALDQPPTGTRLSRSLRDRPCASSRPNLREGQGLFAWRSARVAVFRATASILVGELPLDGLGDGVLPWGWIDNRPWLRYLNGYGLCLWRLSAQARQEGAEIQWGDETGLRSDDVRGRGYAPKGKTPVVLANANRSKLSVISTVTNKGQMRWKVFSGALHARILIGFMKRLAHGRKKRVFLILDNLRVHHSKAVKKWLKENDDKIAVFHLPSYSPELNPDELLNADLKQRITKAAPARNKMALTRTAIRALRSIQKQPTRVESYFEQDDVCYAAA